MVAFLLKILAMLPKGITDRFPADKIMHFIVGAAIGLVGLFFYGPLGALGWAFLAGILKEIYDYLSNERALKKGLPPPHGVEGQDVIATTLGGAVVAAVAFAFGFVF